MLEMGMDMSLFELCSLLVTACTVGFLMGATSIGGVLLVPMVALICDMPIREVIPVGMLVALFSALAGVAVFGQHGAVDRKSAFVSFAPAGLGALVGAAFLPFVPARLFTAGIVAICMLGVVNGLRGTRPVPATPRSSAVVMAIFSGLVGLGSSLSGTSGPMLFVPPSLFLGRDPRQTIGLAQFIQLPITLFASLGYALLGAIDYGLAAILIPAVMIGAVIGARCTQQLAPKALTPIMSLVMLLAGVLTALN